MSSSESSRFNVNADYLRKYPWQELLADHDEKNCQTYWMRRFENHDRKERVMVQDYILKAAVRRRSVRRARLGDPRSVAHAVGRDRSGAG